MNRLLYTLLLHLALLAAFLAMSRVPMSIDLPAP